MNEKRKCLTCGLEMRCPKCNTEIKYYPQLNLEPQNR